MSDIVMPKLSDTMTEGRLVSWKKRVGETVRRGDVLAEVETDKANMELEAFVSGELLEIKVEAGEMASVGAVIAVIGKAAEKGGQPAQPAAAAPPKAEPAAGAPPAAPAAAEAKPAPAVAEPKLAEAEAKAAPTVSEAAGTKPPEVPGPSDFKQDEAQAPVAPLAPATGEAQAAPVSPSTGDEAGVAAAIDESAQPQAENPEAPAPPESRERAAPVVRRRARELGVELSSVQGSGPDGRILLQDLEQRETTPVESRESQPAVARAASAAPAAPTDGPAAGEGAAPLSRLRAAIAKTVSESWRSIPHFTVTMDLQMDESEAVRQQLKQSGVAVTVTDLLVKGVSLALQKFPQLNASFAADGVHRHEEVNIGVAVAVTDGVLIPVVRGCQRLSLPEIGKASRDLAERARAGSLSEKEMSGGTFSVSNLGMYGVSQFTAIIYPSHAAVLAVGAVLDTVVVRAGAPACAKVMKVTLSADHRLVDGAYAAQFLAELKAVMESPVRLLI